MAQLESTLACSRTAPTKQFPEQKGARIYKAMDLDITRLTQRLISGIGGIESLVGKQDIVVLKVNSQWWNQGMTNTDVLKSFIEQVLSVSGFEGEIIIADNHQANKSNSRAWTTTMRNGSLNYNELVQYFNDRGHQNVTKYHWHPAGKNPTPLQFDGQGDAVREHPSEGDGYIWPQDLYYECPHGNRTVLAYPVFTSSFSGTTIDLRHGAFRDRDYTGQPVKFINFSALNHHGRYAGVTASIKNYMGVVDMSCGYPAPEPKGTFNTHHVGASQLFRILSSFQRRLEDVPFYWDICLHPSVFRFRYTGGVLGKFMKVIRPADLHVITAVRVGWGSRFDTRMATQMNTLVASHDPVALDYWAASNILLDASLKAGASEDILRLNNPSIADGPFHVFLEECRREYGGTINPSLMEIVDC